MKRGLTAIAVLLAAGAFIVFAGGASNPNNAIGTYKVELDNAFGLVNGADFKVAGVKAGTLNKIDLCMNTQGCQNPLHALVTVSVTQPGFGAFHSDVFCQSRPQSLVGEYFIECQPGQNGPVLKSGSVIPVTRTQSTIPADLLADVMRMPYRQRFTLIINELGAAVAGRSQDLQAALRRAVPALTQTDNLLKLLADDSITLQQLTANSDAVITALANNSGNVQRFITEANNAATDTATQQTALRASFQKLPAFLEQLRPTLAALGTATDANLPVLTNLNTASGNLTRLINDLPGFANSTKPALKSLGQASVTGKVAVQASDPLIGHLNMFAKSTPELAQNLAIVLHDLDDRSRAVEKDKRSPGGQGFTGLEALLQYVFNQTLAVNTFGPFGHQLAVDAFIDTACTSYATPATVALNLQVTGPSYRRCYSWLGAHQQGVTQRDPSNPGAPVPDPGGAPPGQKGVATDAPKLTAADVQTANAALQKATADTTTRSSTWGPASGGTGSGAPAASTPPNQILSVFGGLTPGNAAPNAKPKQSATTAAPATGTATSSASSSSSSANAASPNQSSSGSSAGSQAQALLNYLLAP
jgi:virulence factor Mce-like protein